MLFRSDAVSDLVRLDTTQEGVAVVTLNRPDARNSFNAELIGALHETFETLKAAEGVRGETSTLLLTVLAVALTVGNRPANPWGRASRPASSVDFAPA